MFEALHSFFGRIYLTKQTASLLERHQTNEADLVGDTLMSELDAHAKEAREHERRKKRCLTRANSAPDYSWLVTSRMDRPRTMTPLRRFEIESLCREVKPSDVGKVIADFREQLLDTSGVEECVDLFMRVVRRHVCQTNITRAMNRGRPSSSLVVRPRLLTGSVERRASFLSLRSLRSSRVTPVECEEVERQQTDLLALT